METHRVLAFGASVTGPLHEENALPCQDAFAIESGTESLLIAVSDGLGSVRQSDLGATEAVKAAVIAGKAAMVEQFERREDLPNLAKSVVVAARVSLEDVADHQGCELRDLACTFIAAILWRGDLVVAHVGDGAVVASTLDRLHVVSGPGESEYANEVVPITGDDWGDSLRISDVLSGVANLAVFTDGCQRAALSKQDGELRPFQGFFGPLFSYASGATDPLVAAEDLRKLLSSEKMTQHSEDDKTLVLAVCEPVEQKPCP